MQSEIFQAFICYNLYDYGPSLIGQKSWWEAEVQSDVIKFIDLSILVEVRDCKFWTLLSSQCEFCHWFRRTHQLIDNNKTIHTKSQKKKEKPENFDFMFFF